MGISAQWSRENLAWAAGLFEGEGCINVGCLEKQRYPSLAMAMTDEDVVRKFHKIIGVGSVGGPYKKQKAHWKPSWRWTCGGHNHVQAVLAALFQFLGQRRIGKAIEALKIGPSLQHNRRRGTNPNWCKNGHQLTEANVYLDGRKRRCRICRNSYAYKWRDKKKNNVALELLKSTNGAS